MIKKGLDDAQVEKENNLKKRSRPNDSQSQSGRPFESKIKKSSSIVEDR